MEMYDPMARQYKQARASNSNIHKYLESYTYFKAMGDISGKSILDLGCGEGIYSRKFQKHGASRVVGVDISPKMIELAAEEEAREALGIEYIVSDMCKLGKIDSFDLVCAAFSLNHAQTKEQLREMCQTIYENLKPNCPFIGINNNLELPPESYDRIKKYGYHRNKIDSSSVQDGIPISCFVFEVDGKQITIDDYYLSKQTYEWAFQEVGFKEINWYKPTFSPEGIRECGEDFWQDLLENPVAILIKCQK